MKRLIALIILMCIALTATACTFIFDMSEQKYLNMSAEEMAALSDSDLYEAVWYRTENKVNAFEDISQGYDSLNSYEKVFYAIDYFDMEYLNGGLCQFLVNTSRAVAPYVSESLRTVGADKHAEMYDSFVSDNRIDLSNLSEFDTDSIDKYMLLCIKYPFDDFDDAFINLGLLRPYLEKYIRENLNEFTK